MASNLLGVLLILLLIVHVPVHAKVLQYVEWMTCTHAMSEAGNVSQQATLEISGCATSRCLGLITVKIIWCELVNQPNKPELSQTNMHTPALGQIQLHVKESTHVLYM